MEVLGSIVSKNSISAAPEKIDMINELSIPHNQEALQEFNGLVNYLGQFVPRLAILAAPLTELAGCTATWQCKDLHTTAFNLIKQGIEGNAVMQPINYQSQDFIYLVCNASAIGMGAWVR